MKLNLRGQDISCRGVRAEMGLTALLNYHHYRKEDRPLQFSSECSRLLMAAVVNQRFRKMLLTDAAKALERGYRNEIFQLTSAERQLILSIQATTLQEFAQQLLRAGETHAQSSESIKFNKS